MFELSRESAVPLVDQICERISQLVRHGQLPAGSRLPSHDSTQYRALERVFLYIPGH